MSYVGSYTFARQNSSNRMVGTEIVRYDNWSTTKNLRLALPYDPAGNPFKMIKAMDVAGIKYLLAQWRRYICRDWSFVTKTPGPEVGSKSGRIDVCTVGLRAKRANGEYLFVEEDLRAKVIMYRLAV